MVLGRVRGSGPSAPGAISPPLLSAASPTPTAPSRGEQRRRSLTAAARSRAGARGADSPRGRGEAGSGTRSVLPAGGRQRPAERPRPGVGGAAAKWGTPHSIQHRSAERPGLEGLNAAASAPGTRGKPASCRDL